MSLEGAPRNPRGLGRAGPGPVGMMALVLVQELTVGRRGVRPRAGAPGQGPRGGGQEPCCVSRRRTGEGRRLQWRSGVPGGSPPSLGQGPEASARDWPPFQLEPGAVRCSHRAAGLSA